MVATIRYHITADFATPASALVLDACGQTAQLRLDAAHAVRVAVLADGTAVSGQCLAVHAWDPASVALHVNDVAYWRAPVPLVHGDCVTLCAAGTSTGGAVRRCFRIEVVVEGGDQPDAALGTAGGDGVRATPAASVREGAPPVGYSSAHEEDDTRSLSSPAQTDAGPATATEETALWHNYYWYQYNVRPDVLGLATHAPLNTAEPTKAHTVAEQAIEALLQRHGRLVALPETAPPVGQACEVAPAEPCARAPRSLVVSHFVVADPDSASATSPAAATAGPPCCGVCPLQRHVRVQRHRDDAASRAMGTTGAIVSQLRALAVQDGLPLVSLAAVPSDEADAPAPSDAPRPTRTTAADNDKAMRESPWDAYMHERARIAAEREQQALERERKKLEKNGDSTAHLTTEHASPDTLAEVERALRRISELEYILNGPYYVS